VLAVRLLTWQISALFFAQLANGAFRLSARADAKLNAALKHPFLSKKHCINGDVLIDIKEL
jgi:hypothetical protein